MPERDAPKTRAALGDPGTLVAWRHRVFQVIESGRGDNRASKIFDFVLVFLILISIAAFVLETVPSIKESWGLWLNIIEYVSVAFFTVEYALRIWTAVELPFLSRMTPTRARLRFARRPFLIFDLLAILPFYLAFLLPFDLIALRAFRLIRLFKLTRYSPAMHTLIRTIYNERRSLIGATLLLLTVLLLAATGMYHLERHVQPDKFGNVPDAAYWAMTTLTTVGYGDATPVTPAGKFLAMLTMLIGLCVLALPVAIIATGFSQEVGRRDFVVSWALVSRIPALADLDAREVEEVLPMLHALNFPAHWDVIKAGDPGDAMYFVAWGKLVAKAPGGNDVLGTGEFFGEIALIDEDVYRYTRTTATRCRLLKLHRADFQRLMHAHPQIGRRILKVAEDRKTARQKDDERAETMPPTGLTPPV